MKKKRGSSKDAGKIPIGYTPPPHEFQRESQKELREKRRHRKVCRGRKRRRKTRQNQK